MNKPIREHNLRDKFCTIFWRGWLPRNNVNAYAGRPRTTRPVPFGSRFGDGTYVVYLDAEKR